jgi:uncharacterized protein
MSEVIDNPARGRFELSEDGDTAVADYRINGNTLYIEYVESPPALRGKGTAGRLMRGVMDAARERDLKVIPICGYAAAWIRRHDEYADMAG